MAKSINVLIIDTLKEYDLMVSSLSKGYPLTDPIPLIKRMIMIDLLNKETLQDNTNDSIIDYLISNEHFKK